MGFFDRDVKNGFDRMFDVNHDGKLGPGEQAMQFTFVDEMIGKNEPEDDGLTFDNEDILDEIDGMDEDEAREYLESEGYDPDDFEF